SELYKKCLEVEKKDQGENWAVSPVTMLRSMIMALDGSSGQSRHEIEHAFSIRTPGITLAGDKDTQEDVKIHTSLAHFKLDHPALKMANILYLNKNNDLKESFVTEQKNLYGATAKSLDISDSGEINLDVSNATDNLLGDIISVEDVSVNSVMLLVAGLFYNVKFLEASKTTVTDFNQSDYTSNQITYIGKSGMIDYCEIHEHHHSQLRAKGFRFKLENGMSLVIVLPDDNDGLQKINKDMEESLLESMLAKKHYKKKHLTVYIPKFEVEGRSEMTK
ncbi:hypothetical protein Ciccas_014609, partial [Cichlidogyrus casuarinus]